MANTLDLSSIMRQLVQEAGSSAPGALQAAAAGDKQSADLERQRLDEGAGFLRNFDTGSSDPMLSFSAALMGPTKTGSFGESFGNAIEKGVGAMQLQRKAKLDQFDRLQRIQEGRAKLAAADGAMKLQQLQRGLGMVGGLDAAQTALANTDLNDALANMRSRQSVAPVTPVSGLTPLVQPDTSGSAPDSSPFGALPVKRPGSPVFPIEHGAVTTTPPEMNRPSGMVIGGDNPSPMPASPSSPAMSAPSAQAPSPPQTRPMSGSDSNGVYMGETLTPDAIRQIQAAQELKAIAIARPRAPKSAAVVQQADAVIKKYVPDGWYFDSASQRIIPTGKESIAYKKAEADAKRAERETPDEAARKTAATEYVKNASKVAANYGSSQKYLNDIDTLAELSRAAPDGSAGKWKAWLFEKTGYAYGDDATAMQAFLSSAKQLLPGMLADMKPVSDTDMKVMSAANGQIENSREAREVIFGMLRAKAEYDVEMAKIARQVTTGQLTPAQAAAKEDALGTPQQYLDKVRKTPAYQQILGQVQKKGVPGARSNSPAPKGGALQPGRYIWDPQKGVIAQ